MSSEQEHRSYRSPLRNRRARETRRRILAAAQQLILERGYGSTTMRDIADTAGVAIQTIYSSVGTKQDILTAFIDQIEDDARLHEFENRFRETDSPREHLRLRAAASRAIFDQGIDTIETLIRAQGTSPEIAEVLEKGDGRHRQSVKEWIVDRWDDTVFREDLSYQEVIDLISMLSGSEVYRWLIRRYQWSSDRYEDWLYQTLVDHILRPDRES